MTRDHATQFPPLRDLQRYSQRRFVDPAVIDRPTEPQRDVSTFRAALRDAFVFAVLMLLVIVMPALFYGI